MRLFRFGPEVALPITQGDSQNASIGRGVRVASPAQVGVVHLGAGGRIWRHPATVPQLLLVVAGSGEVSGGDGAFVPVGPGMATFWAAGELHETRSEHGLTAVIIEAEDVDPTAFMPPA